jgi:NADH-quinone oxidoreductase subunit D
LGFGPAHPAAHGVLSFSISLIFGKVISLDSINGLLCRHTEKLMENRSPIKILNYYERLDYVSIFAMEICFSKIVELFYGVSRANSFFKYLSAPIYY